MATIEERASEYVHHRHNDWARIAKGAYEKGATDQRKIDEEEFHAIIAENYERGFAQGQQKSMEEGYNSAVDKACEWLDVTLSNIVNTMKEVPDVFPCIEPIHREEFINNFRNAMEE